MAGKPRRYSGTSDFYRKKLTKHMTELGLQKGHYDLKYDPWEGVRLDFTYKGVTRRLERLIDNKTIHYGSDCLAQVVLTMEKFLWMKREGIFDLDVAAAGLPQLMPAIPECFRQLGFDRIPADVAEVNDRHRALAKKAHPDGGGSDEAFKRLQRAADEARKFLEVKLPWK